jgi:putative lipoic acid-binding regulatory protein
MEYLPSLELLEATHTFPGPYMFKVIGTVEENFVGRVVAAVRSQLPEEIEPSFSIRRTENGRHACVTIEPTLAGAEDVIEIYSRLRELEGLVMLF